MAAGLDPGPGDEDGGSWSPSRRSIVEYLDRLGDAPPLIPTEPAAALQARLWDRVFDGQVMTPMQKIVVDNLRPEGAEDPHGVAEARGTLDRAYELLDGSSRTAAGLAGPRLHPGRLRRRAGALLRPRRPAAGTGPPRRRSPATSRRSLARPSVARVIEEARPYRELFPLPWPDYAD